MGPLNTVIKKHNIDIEIGKYTHTDGNKFIFKYATSRSLQQLHNLDTPFSGAVDTIVEDRRYFLGDKTLDMTTKYEVYIYHRSNITHSNITGSISIIILSCIINFYYIMLCCNNV